MDSKGALMEISADGKLKIEFKPSQTVKTGDSVTVKFGEYSVSGKISGVSSGKATAVISDSYYYDVDKRLLYITASAIKAGFWKAEVQQPDHSDGRQGNGESH